MTSSLLPRVAALAAMLCFAAAAAANPVLSEFMADNETGLRDEDNTLQDWIEFPNSDLVTQRSLIKQPHRLLKTPYITPSRPAQFSPFPAP